MTLKVGSLRRPFQESWDSSCHGHSHPLTPGSYDLWRSKEGHYLPESRVGTQAGPTADERPGAGEVLTPEVGTPSPVTIL